MEYISYTTTSFSGSCLSQPVRNILSETKGLKHSEETTFSKFPGMESTVWVISSTIAKKIPFYPVFE